METLKATVEQADEKYLLTIEDGAQTIRIPLSVNEPAEVKSAFNKLICRIKDGEFQIEIGDVGDDLFSQVAQEYITQLNREINEVRREMKQHGLVAESPTPHA
jgi:hypothetical protein